MTSEAPPKWCASLPAGIRSRSWSGHSSPGVPLARMRILIVSPRMPTPGGKGDQIRAFQFAQALAPQHSVQVLTTGAGVDSSQDVSALAEIRVSDASRLSRALGGLGRSCAGSRSRSAG